ncbi:hypothetical protein [Nocardia sp. NPDC052112]|uniref:hypothetical protein n=1 Tax=Nocardia sp. NPDC052112 TaxID=3155646 RepID=UPI0034238876
MSGRTLFRLPALGYHRAIVGTRLTRPALGHFGIGGIANPGLGLGIGFVTNHLGNHAMSLGDARLPFLAALIERAARAAAAERPAVTFDGTRAAS